MHPTVLLCTTCRWFSTARLAMALANAGCRVEAVCPGGHPIAETGAAFRKHAYRALTPLRSIDAAIRAAKPDLVIPCDDLATSHLHRLHERETRLGRASVGTAALIERSLGTPDRYPLIASRGHFLALARDQEFRVPETEIVESISDLRRWHDRAGFPAVLKADGTSGGGGVRVVRCIEGAERAFRTLKAPPSAVRAAKRAIFDRDRTLLVPSLLRKRRTVSVQAFIKGREATTAVACWQGRILASISVEVLNTWKLGGPASVVRLIDDVQGEAAAKLVRSLGLSGICGFDFIIEDSTEEAYLIEMNPRSTQICHLALGEGRDLPAALRSRLSGEPQSDAPRVTERDTIALFPQEWQRDPASEYLHSAFHDVPWAEPDLIRACIRRRPFDRLLGWSNGLGGRLHPEGDAARPRSASGVLPDRVSP